MRRKLLLGNWKMHKTASEAEEFARASLPLAELAKLHDIDIGVAPGFLSLNAVKQHAGPDMIVAAQNVHFAPDGAYTGEVSIPMLEEFGIDWVIVGHSERRTYFNETSATCFKKIKALLDRKMTPVYCVGETLDEFNNGLTEAVVSDALRVGLKGLTPEEAKRLIIAYEPIWSIGTGKNASADIAEKVCSFIRKVLKEMFGNVAEDIRILYGGSVKPVNVKAYLTCPDIDGALVGGASLEIASFKSLLENIL